MEMLVFFLYGNHWVSIVFEFPRVPGSIYSYVRIIWWIFFFFFQNFHFYQAELSSSTYHLPSVVIPRSMFRNHVSFRNRIVLRVESDCFTDSDKACLPAFCSNNTTSKLIPYFRAVTTLPQSYPILTPRFPLPPFVHRAVSVNTRVSGVSPPLSIGKPIFKRNLIYPDVMATANNFIVVVVDR